MRRLNCQRAPRPWWLQLISLYLVSGLLWYASLTLVTAGCFLMKILTCPILNLNKGTFEKSLNPTLINFYLGKIKCFSAGWSGTSPGSATFMLLRSQHGSDWAQGQGATPKATRGAGLKPCRSVKKSQSWSFPSRVCQCGATCCCVGGWTGRAAFLRSTMGSPFPFYRVSRRWERKGLGSALPSAEGRYLQLSGTNSNACRQLGQRKMRMSLCVCVWTLNKIYTLVINTVLCYALLLGHVQLSVTPWTAAGQAPLSMGILQARILEWVAMSSSRGSYWPRNWTRVSCIAGGFFTSSATREALTILYHLLISIFFKQHSISLYIENWIRSFKAHSKKCF